MNVIFIRPLLSNDHFFMSHWWSLYVNKFDCISCNFTFQSEQKKYFFLSAFHSCVGGCNGCINLNQSSNAGLAEALEPLEDKYLKLGLEEQGISRADFWAFAGMIAIEKGASLDIGSVKLPCLVVNNNRICNVAFMAEFDVNILFKDIIRRIRL